MNGKIKEPDSEIEEALVQFKKNTIAAIKNEEHIADMPEDIKVFSEEPQLSLERTLHKTIFGTQMSDAYEERLDSETTSKMVDTAMRNIPESSYFLDIRKRKVRINNVGVEANNVR